MKTLKSLFILLIAFCISGSLASCSKFKPHAYFEYEALGNNTIRFINKSDHASKYQWHFGDGEMSTEENPVHVFDVSRNEINEHTGEPERWVTVTLMAYPKSANDYDIYEKKVYVEK